MKEQRSFREGGRLSPKGEGGFTLVELMVVMLIFLVVMLMTIGLFLGFNDSISATRTFSTVGEKVYQATFEMSAELRSAAVPPGAVGTNVLIPQSSISQMSSTVAFCIESSQVSSSTSTSTSTTTAGLTPSAFLYDQWSFLNVGGSLGLYHYTNTSTSPCNPSGSAPPTTPPTGVKVLGNLAKGYFCYLGKAGANMTGQSGCPGSAPGVTYSTSAQIATCAVAVYAVIVTAASRGVGPVSISLGTALPNQNAQLVTEQAVLPSGSPTPC